MKTLVLVCVKFRGRQCVKLVECFDNKVPWSFIDEMAAEIGATRGDTICIG